MYLVPVARMSSPLARSIERLFDDRVFGSAAEPALRSPSLDVAETDAQYTVSIDLPVVAKEDVKITIDGRRVDISAQSKHEQTKKDGERVIYRERSASSFSRRFTLPEAVDQDASQAKLDNGVLSLTLAKKRAGVSRQLTVN
jgi:HSP20 family protein